MLAYFTASIVGKKYHLEKYQKIIDLLEERGIEVIAEHILGTTEDQIRLQGKRERLAFHRQLEDWINSCDFMIAETSFPSISVGYEISLALHRNKPVLILYSEGDPPSLLDSHESEKIVCEKYTLATLLGIINDFLLYVRGSGDTRFTFFIGSKQASYLEKIAKKERLPKSAYLRRLIDQDMQRHQT
ncbi:MAG: nucleoside 2-deoxyribosyltransferase [Patescibacteria group bacterium]